MMGIQSKEGVLPAVYFHQWISYLFVTVLPFSLVLRSFDLLLVEGPRALVRVALAVLKCHQTDLLKLKFGELTRRLSDLRHEPFGVTTEEFVRTANSFNLHR